MLALSFDTASESTTAAIGRITADGVELIAERSEVANNRHGELLAPMIAEVLAAADAKPSELGRIVVGVGPGPFTGLRVGLVTAAALGQSLDLEVVGVCSLDAVAFAAERPWAEGFAVLSDARRREVYWARYADGQRISPPAVNRPADLEALPKHVVGAGALIHRDLLPEGTVVDGTAAYPSASALLRLSIDETWVTELRPMYLRRPDAVPSTKLKTVTPV